MNFTKFNILKNSKICPSCKSNLVELQSNQANYMLGKRTDPNIFSKYENGVYYHYYFNKFRTAKISFSDGLKALHLRVNKHKSVLFCYKCGYYKVVPITSICKL